MKCKIVFEIFLNIYLTYRLSNIVLLEYSIKCYTSHRALKEKKKFYLKRPQN